MTGHTRLTGFLESWCKSPWHSILSFKPATLVWCGLCCQDLLPGQNVTCDSMLPWTTIQAMENTFLSSRFYLDNLFSGILYSSSLFSISVHVHKLEPLTGALLFSEHVSYWLNETVDLFSVVLFNNFNRFPIILVCNFNFPHTLFLTKVNICRIFLLHLLLTFSIDQYNSNDQ